MRIPDVNCLQAEVLTEPEIFNPLPESSLNTYQPSERHTHSSKDRSNEAALSNFSRGIQKPCAAKIRNEKNRLYRCLQNSELFPFPICVLECHMSISLETDSQYFSLENFPIKGIVKQMINQTDDYSTQHSHNYPCRNNKILLNHVPHFVERTHKCVCSYVCVCTCQHKGVIQCGFFHRVKE